MKVHNNDKSNLINFIQMIIQMEKLKPALNIIYENMK